MCHTEGAGQQQEPARRRTQFLHSGRRVRPAPPPPPRKLPRGGRRQRAGKPEVEMEQPDGKCWHTGQGAGGTRVTLPLDRAVPRGCGRERAGKAAGRSPGESNGRGHGNRPITGVSRGRVGGAAWLPRRPAPGVRVPQTTGFLGLPAGRDACS